MIIYFVNADVKSQVSVQRRIQDLYKHLRRKANVFGGPRLANTFPFDKDYCKKNRAKHLLCIVSGISNYASDDLHAGDGLPDPCN